MKHKEKTKVDNKTMIPHLIEMVKEFPCLWDTRNPSYRNPELADQAWNEIASALQLPDGKMAKFKWKNIRSTFRETLRTQRERKRLQNNCKTYKFSKQLSFLIPHLSTRDNVGTFCTDTSSLGSSSEATEHPTKVETTQYPTVVETTQHPTIVETTQQPTIVGATQHPTIVQFPEMTEGSPQMFHIPIVRISTLPDSALTQSSVKKPHNSMKLIKNSGESSKSVTDQKSHIIRIQDVYHTPPSPHNSEEELDTIGNGEAHTLCQQTLTEGSPVPILRKKLKTSNSDDSNGAEESKSLNTITKGDALMSFFKSMYNTTLKLPPEVQLEIKRKIFEIVTNAEESCLGDG